MVEFYDDNLVYSNTTGQTYNIPPQPQDAEILIRLPDGTILEGLARHFSFNADGTGDCNFVITSSGTMPPVEKPKEPPKKVKKTW